MNAEKQTKEQIDDLPRPKAQDAIVRFGSAWTAPYTINEAWEELRQLLLDYEFELRDVGAGGRYYIQNQELVAGSSLSKRWAWPGLRVVAFIKALKEDGLLIAPIDAQHPKGRAVLKRGGLTWKDHQGLDIDCPSKQNREVKIVYLHKNFDQMMREIFKNPPQTS